VKDYHSYLLLLFLLGKNHLTSCQISYLVAAAAATYYLEHLMGATVLSKGNFFLVVWDYLGCHHYVAYAGLLKTFQKDQQ
jgi:hypothetical protein